MADLTGARVAVASLVRARARTAWAAASLALLAALASCLLGLDASVHERARRELSRYGPNVVVRGADAGAPSFPLDWVPAPAELAAHGVETAAAIEPAVEGEPVVVEVLAGRPDGAWLAAATDGAAVEAGRLREAARVSVRVEPEAIDAFVAWLPAAAPGLEAQVVQRVAWTEARVLARTGAFVTGTAAVLLVLCGLCFASTLLAQWLERAPEVGLLLALGATRRRVAGLLARELAAMALAGGLAGGVAGALLGWLVLRAGFSWDGSLAAWPWWSVGAALAITCAVAACSGAVPLWRALRIAPLAALRGE